VIFFRALDCIILALLYRRFLHPKAITKRAPTLLKDVGNNSCLKMALKEDAGNFYSKDVGIFSDLKK
jgi:hypothetical protein